MRAYLSVNVGRATFQDANLHFAAQPAIENSGLTPARNVRRVAVVGIIDGTDPSNTHFADVGPLDDSEMGMGPRQSFTVYAVLPARVPDGEVAGIMAGATRRLYCWGKITYDDVYGGSWETHFCLNYVFFKGDDGEIKVNGYFYPKGNGAT